MNRSKRGWVAACALIALVVLALWRVSSAEPGAALPPFSEDPLSTETWLRAPEAPAVERCSADPVTGAPREMTIGLTIFRGPDVSDALVESQLHTLSRVYAPSGLRFVTDGPPRAIAMEEAAAARVETTSVSSAAPGSPERDALWRELLAPALGFIAEYGVPPRRAIHVVFMKRISPTLSTVRRLLPHLTGLTLTSADAEPDVGALLGVLGFTPTVFLSAEDIGRLPADRLPTTLAHEVGHALGLSHEEAPDDLMAESAHDCLPRLTDAQASALRPP